MCALPRGTMHVRKLIAGWIPSQPLTKSNVKCAWALQIAEEFNVAVLITNHVMSDPSGGAMFVSDPKKPVGGHVMVSLHANVYFIIMNILIIINGIIIPFKAQYPHCLLRESILISFRHISLLHNRILTGTRLYKGNRRISIVESSTQIPVNGTLKFVAGFMMYGLIQAHASTVRLSLRKGKGEQRLMKVVDAPNLGELLPLKPTEMEHDEIAWDHDLFRPANLLSSTPCKGGWL